jgi:hypothetical protein
VSAHTYLAQSHRAALEEEGKKSERREEAKGLQLNIAPSACLQKDQWGSKSQ